MSGWLVWSGERETQPSGVECPESVHRHQPGVNVTCESESATNTITPLLQDERYKVSRPLYPPAGLTLIISLNNLTCHYLNLTSPPSHWTNYTIGKAEANKSFTIEYFGPFPETAGRLLSSLSLRLDTSWSWYDHHQVASVQPDLMSSSDLSGEQQ